jgi:hypothetical protein
MVVFSEVALQRQIKSLIQVLDLNIYSIFGSSAPQQNCLSTDNFMLYISHSETVRPAKPTELLLRSKYFERGKKWETWCGLY